MARVPPWRRWVAGRERVPKLSFRRDDRVREIINESIPRFSAAEYTSMIEAPEGDKRNTSLIPRTPHGLVLTDREAFMDNLSSSIPSLRKFLVGSSTHSSQARCHLDGICTSVLSQLNSITPSERLRLIGIFSQVKDYSVVNRVHERYNNKPLLYQNPDFFKQLVSSIDWSNVLSWDLSRARTLSPLVSLIRAVNRMGIPRDQMHEVLEKVFNQLQNHRPFGTPPHLVELVSIAAKNRYIDASFFELIGKDVSMKIDSYPEDLLGDLARAYTNLDYESPAFLAALADRLPITVHELAWWNLVDIAGYYAKVVVPRGSVDPDMIARFGNECWKWIPDMRSGYAAKALRVLTTLNTGDKRTIRSLIRAIPKSINKLHPHVAAESVVAAVRAGYHPRTRYGKKYGSLFYKRLSHRLVNSDSEGLKAVDADLVLAVLESLATIERPENELLDFVIRDVVENSFKYSKNHLVGIDRILNENFRFSRGKEVIRNLIVERTTEELTVKNLAYQAITSADAMAELVALGPGPIVQLEVDDIDRLLRCRHEQLTHIITDHWIDQNLFRLSPSGTMVLLRSLAESDTELDETQRKLIEAHIDNTGFSSPDQVAVSISALLSLSGYSFVPPDRLLNVLTSSSTMDRGTIGLCQLVCGHLKLTPRVCVSDAMLRFFNWIESHLLSKYPQVADSTEFRSWYVPNGAVTDLSVFPVTIPLALPDPRIDLRGLHHSRTTRAVRKVLAPYLSDTGVALVRRDEGMYSLPDRMRDLYLQRLGWTVRSVKQEHDVQDPSIINASILGYQSPNTS